MSTAAGERGGNAEDRTGHWSGIAQAYAASFASLCHGGVPGLLDAAEAAAGAGGLMGRRLLDVGTGTGAVAAEAVRRGAAVTAVDPDPELLTLGAAAFEGPTLLAALPDLPFGDASYDVVVAGFVVNQLGDPRAGVRELVRVASTAVAVTIWPSGPRPSATLLEETLRRAGAQPPPGTRLPAELDFERSVPGLGALLQEAGLADVVTAELRFPWRIAPQTWWTGIAGGVGVVGRTYLAQDDAGRARLRAAYDDVVGERLADQARQGRSGTELDLDEVAVVAAGRHP
ncbi:class I SAM-dependent methyltransferase [Nocardioides sp. zg-DK7169]|uniref:class I SAM-dependent methyltransferase n=1 Tax=Nocardioides sp. zg-DK7169 TaxID=2736600 RepID=UPI001553A80E|nr:class I SAM-dependent methyltransferase [Nocardioides sp. zg-DK7169]NPC96422.1 class I SAM-dependent methyltransferase [Nocardioides sp. zg-DK7169]